MFFFMFCLYKQQNFMHLAQLLVQLKTIITPFFFLCNPSASNSALRPLKTISPRRPLIYIYVSQDYLRTDDGLHLYFYHTFVD